MSKYCYLPSIGRPAAASGIVRDVTGTAIPDKEVGGHLPPAELEEEPLPVSCPESDGRLKI